MKSKVTRYIKYLPQMEAKFGRKITVLFVLDIERNGVREFVKRVGGYFSGTDISDFVGPVGRDVGSVADGDQSASSVGDRFPSDPFFFTDFETLKHVPVGEALKAKIYFWTDGNQWSLANND